MQSCKLDKTTVIIKLFKCNIDYRREQNMISNALPLPISTMRGNVGSLKTSFQSGTRAGIYPET